MLGLPRGSGANLPLSDLRRGQGVALDGYFWRLTDPRHGRVVVALCGVCRDGTGTHWATVALAAHPGGHLVWRDLPHAQAARDRYAVRSWGEDGRFAAGPARVDLELGDAEASLELDITPRRDWSRPLLSGVGAAQLIPGLGQYWHPHLLAGEVRGFAQIGGEEIRLDGWQAYAERNWGAGGFPERWWWGQAQGFARPDLCVAFAGGVLSFGPARLEATGLVLDHDAGRLCFHTPVLSPVRASADGSRWRLSASRPGWRLDLEGRADPADAHHLPVPRPVARASRLTAQEHLAGEMSVTLRRGGRIVLEDHSRLAGLEVGRAPRAA